MTLRPYQEDCLTAINEAFDGGKDRVMAVLATGLGKTVIFSSLIHQWREQGRVHPGRPAVVIAHREELLHQAADKLRVQDEWIRIGIERAGDRAPASSEVIVASVQTIGRPNSSRLAEIDPALVIVDECHHSAATSYQHALQKLGAFGPKGTKTLGVTATPHRLDNRRLEGKGATFEAEVFRYTIREGITQDYLCDLRGFQVRTETDLSKVKSRGGDYVESDLAKVLEGDTRRTLEAIKAWKEHAHDRRTIVFCSSVGHAHETAELWAGETGAPSVCIHGGTPTETRRQLMDMFRAGHVQVLTNVDIATEGFDVPEVSCIVMLKPTKSWTKYVQMAGRGTRLSPGKSDCVIIDMVDLSSDHSLCTVPAMVGLPAKINLKGATLSEAAEIADKVSENSLESIAKLADPRKAPRSLDDLRILCRNVDLLEGSKMPKAISSVARYAWVQMANGSLMLDTQVGTARVRMDALGNGHIDLLKNGKVEKSYPAPVGIPLDQVVMKAEVAAETVFGKEALKWKKQSSGWRKSADPVTPAQCDLLRRLGANLTTMPPLTKAQASQLIDRLRAEKVAV